MDNRDGLLLLFRGLADGGDSVLHKHPLDFFYFRDLPPPLVFFLWSRDQGNKKCANDFGEGTAPLISKKPNHLPGILSPTDRVPSPVIEDLILFNENFVLRNGTFNKKTNRPADFLLREGGSSRKLRGGLIGFAEGKTSIITSNRNHALFVPRRGTGYGRTMAYFLIESKRGFSQK